MSGMMTRWLVLDEHSVTGQDVDHDGTVSDEAVERWVNAARLAYLDRCTLLRQEQAQSGLELTYRNRALPGGPLLGRPSSVVVTASASEVSPSSFTISVRLRPLGGDRETVVNTSCVVRWPDAPSGEARQLDKAIRDELIALEHSATHFN
jgi:acyl-CoA thioesterase FadM